ncbi:MAG: signal peptidase II [Clostridiales bacterium]|nr:signal peptidase II [Clostridiales bacterium]
MKSKLQNLSMWIILSGILVAADRWTKSLAVLFLQNREPVVVIPGVFELLYSENRGAAFGVMQGRQMVFLVIAAVVLAVSFYAMWNLPDFSKKRYHWLKICICMITAGAVGNMIDRIACGYVVDFLYVALIDFPVFNVADICVTCAAFLLVALMMFYYTDEELEVLHFSKCGGK